MSNKEIVEVEGKLEKSDVKGRQKKAEKRYTITFDPKATALVKKYAEEEGVSMAEIIRRALNFYELKRLAERERLGIELVGKDESGKEKRIKVLTRLV
jgi:hypothetical protein